jgi:parvulin-like peptidyl-prolyl isomerase
MSRIATLWLALGLAACTLTTAALAQQPGMGPGPMHGGKGGGMMSPERQQARQQMMEQMNAYDARLDELVVAMNQAQGQAKVDAIAAVLNEMIAQRREMRAHRERMWQKRGGKMMGAEEPTTTP